MVENESTRSVGSIILMFWPMFEYRWEGSEVEQPWFWLDGCSLSFQGGSHLQCWSLEARNYQDLNSLGFHMCYKTKVPLVCSTTNPYPLTCVRHCHGILHGQQLHPIGRGNYLVYNARLLPNDPRCQTEKGDHTSIQNAFHVDQASDWTTGKGWSNLMFAGRSLEKEDGLFLKANLIDC